MTPDYGAASASTDFGQAQVEEQKQEVKSLEGWKQFSFSKKQSRGKKEEAVLEQHRLQFIFPSENPA